MSERRILPQRRYTETFDMRFGDQNTLFKVSVGYWADRRDPAEVFVTGAKTGSEYDALARDAAIVLSISLQHGVPITAFGSAMTRDQDSAPSSIIGAVIDRMTPGDVK